MVQHQVDQALDNLEYVKKRLQILADKQPAATRRTYLEMVGIIDEAMLAAHETGADPELTFPMTNYTSD